MANEANLLPPIFTLCLEASSTVLTAPIFDFLLVIDPARSTAHGMVEMKQKIEPPIVRFNVTGTFHELIFGAELAYVISLKGEYAIPFPPPAIGERMAPFNAVILLDKNYNGKGTLHYGNGQVEQAIVKQVNNNINAK